MVGRASKMRQDMLGTKWYDAQQEQHARECLDLVRKRTNGAAAVGEDSKAAKATETREGLGSLDFATAYADTIFTLTGKTLDAWCTPGPLPLDRIPRALVLCMDFEQLQWRAGWWFRHRAGIN